MLGSHSRCIATPESQFVVDAFKRFYQGDQIGVSRALEHIQGHWRYKVWELPACLSQTAEQQNSIQEYANRIQALVQAYAAQQGRPDDELAYWIDHTPENIRHALTLSRIFPEAKFIHIVRDGRAVAASIAKLDWGPRTIQESAKLWLKEVGLGLAAQHHFGQRLTLVRYEDLVLQPHDTLQQLCQFIGVCYEPDMVNGRGFKVPAYTAKQHELIGQKPDPSRIQQWHAGLSGRQIEIFEALAGDILRYLGYETVYGWEARRPDRIERLAMYGKTLIAGKLNEVKRHNRRKPYMT